MDTLALNNREIALLIWGGVAFALTLWKFGPSLFDGILRMLFEPKVGLPLLAYVAYVAGVLFLLSDLDLWGWALLPDAVLWAIVVGLPLFHAAGTREPSAMRKRVAAALSVTLLIEVFVNLAVAPLPVELVALPLITVLGVLVVYIQHHPENQAAAGPVEWLLTILGVAAIAFVAISIAADWEGFDKLEAVRELVLPIALTVALVPFLGALWSYSAFYSARARRRPSIG